MNSQINHYVEAMFSGLPRTKEIVEMRLNITEHMTDKFEALRAEGKNEYEALGIVISEFGSMEEIKKAFGVPDAPPEPLPAPARDPELAALEEEYRAFQPRARLARAVAIMLFILAPFISGSAGSVMLLFICVAAGVGLLIYFGGRTSDYRALLRQREALLRQRAQPGLAPPPDEETDGDDYPGASRRRRVFYSLLPLVAVVVYLWIGFIWDLWHPGWIIFLCVPLLIGIFEIVRTGEGDGGERK